VLIIGCVLAGAWYAFLYTPYQPLFGGLRVADAATIVAELDRRKIPYHLADGGSAILVPADLVDATRLNVMGEDLPLKGTVGLELFDKSDMGLTDFAQKINYQRALQGELERTIMSLDGVEAARVHLSMGEDRIFRDDQVPPKASVTVRMRRGAVLSPSAAQGVRRLVAAAVPKLDIANVVILNEEGQIVGTAQSAAPPGETVAPAVEEKRAIEQYYEARIRDVLARGHWPVPIGVSVEAEVAMSPENSAPADALATWSPASRQFPLQVTLSSTPLLETATQATVRDLVSSAVAAQPQDAVSFAADGPAPRQPEPGPSAPMARPAVTAPASIADDGYDWFGEAAVTLLLLLLILAAVYVVLRQARAPRRLTAQERADLALRLRAALNREDEHAAIGS